MRSRRTYEFARKSSLEDRRSKIRSVGRSKYYCGEWETHGQGFYLGPRVSTSGDCERLLCENSLSASVSDDGIQANHRKCGENGEWLHRSGGSGSNRGSVESHPTDVRTEWLPAELSVRVDTKLLSAWVHKLMEGEPSAGKLSSSDWRETSQWNC